MKHLLFIISILFITNVPLSAQDKKSANDDNQKIRDKMNEYIQKRLDLTKEEAAQFSPVFIRYFKEWRQTIRENKGDRLVMQQKIVALRLRYRTTFREIIGESRGDQVFNQQERFIKEIRELQGERLQNNPKRLKRNATNFIIK